MNPFAMDTAHGDLMYKGIKVAPEYRCSPYNRNDYPYPQSIELEIIKGLGGIMYGPYTGTCFHSRYASDIEHIVSLSEAHDSGLCAASKKIRRRFATDLLNLTLASPQVNRYQKSGKDFTEWRPAKNACWFAQRILDIRRKYDLTIDLNEADAIQRVLSKCNTTAMTVKCNTWTSPKPRPQSDNATLQKYDENRDGRITCREARRHGIAPVHKSHPAYVYMRDGDGDGTVCE